MPESKKFLSHTADIRLKVSAETLPRLFELCLNSMNRLLIRDFDKRKYTSDISKKIHLESADRTSLLIDFLSEVLTLSHVSKAVFFEMSIESITDNKITAVLDGTIMNSFDEDIKAVTYHEADVRLNENGDWETILIFDI